MTAVENVALFATLLFLALLFQYVIHLVVR